MSYDINSIQSLTFTEGVRRRVQVYLGSANVEGIWQGLKEIINNSTDEALAGYGNKIIISIDEQNQIFSIRDFGRSVPYGIRKNGENVLVSIFSEAHTGGKFNHKVYAQSVGTNGIGASATCLSSEYFIVKSYRDNNMGMAKWVKGINTEYKELSDIKEDTGTYIEYKPDYSVFKDAEEKLSYDRILEEVENLSYLNSKIYFTVINKNTNEVKNFYSENGVVDFINSKVKNPLMKQPILATASDSTDSVEIAFIWTKDTSQSHVFVNGGYCDEGGSPITGAKTTITTSIKKLSGKDFDPELIRKGLVYAINCKVANPSFANQTKSKINNPNLRTLTSQAFKQGLEEFANSSDFSSIIEMMTTYQKAERAANKTREAILETNKNIETGLKKKIVLSQKLVDCRRHDESSQLMICEGHSARGALVKARNSETTACIEIRGKLINLLKNDDEKIAKNEEVRDIDIALGCGIGDKFNIKKLRYGKIVIMADMDKDGFDIVCLILTYFYKRYPALLKAGKIYWGVTPLFKMIYKGKSYFAYNEEELKTLPKGELTRMKGLGESQPEDFRATIFSDNARMVQMTMEDGLSAEKYFNILLGKDIEARREYVFKNANFENLED